jgi:mannose-6-phosphate isomerase-like protein (cupin superfamily)
MDDMDDRILINGFILREGNGKQISFRGTKMTVKVSSDYSEDKYSLIEMVHQPNVGPSLHIHPTAPEAYYVLEGNYIVKYGKENHQLEKGDFVFIPKGVPHNYQSGPSGGRVLVISPAGLEKYFEEVAHVLKTRPVTWELEQEIANRYGQKFLDHLNHWGQ